MSEYFWRSFERIAALTRLPVSVVAFFYITLALTSVLILIGWAS